MTPAALRTLIVADVRVLCRDPLLIWMTAMPLAMGLLIRVIVSVVAEASPAATFDLAPYHALIMGGYLMTAPGMIGFVIGFLLLDERDAGTLRALRVTPMSSRHYLAYRIAGPLLAGTLSTVIGYPIAGLAPVSAGALVTIAATASLAAPLLALVLAIVSPNKVAGFAAVKVLNGLNLLPIAAYFVPLPAQLVAGVLPTYWPMRALWSATAGDAYLHFVAAGAVAGIGAISVAARLFELRLRARA